MTALWLLLTTVMPTATAQDCDPIPEALGDLNAIVSLFLEETGGAADYCPEDLGQPIDLADADTRAAKLDAQERADAAEMLLESVAGLGGEHLQAVANAAGLLDALLGAGLAAGDDVAAIVDALLELAEGTEDPLLHRQIALNLWRRGVEDPRVAELVEHYLPKAPDYDRIFPDGKTEVHATLRTGSDGFKHSDFEEVFERKGAEVEVIEEDEHLRITYEITPDDPTLPKVTWILDIFDHGHGPRDVFEDMDEDDVNVTMFADHSQLGTSLDRSLDNAPDATESTDFFWNDACKSKVFASRLSQAYPAGHFVYTVESEYFRDMPISYERGLVALANRYDYEEMRRLVGAGSAWQSKNYIFPDDAQKLVYQDQDGDGLADSEDRLYDVGALDQGGELASRAAHIANTYVGYSSGYTGWSNGSKQDPEDEYRPDGLFDGEPGGPSTRIEQRKDAYGEDKWFVAVSDELVGMDKTQRTALIAADIGTHQGLQQGWEQDKAEAGGFLAGAAVYDVWYGSGWSDYQEHVMPDLEMRKSEATGYLDDHDFVTSKSLKDFLADRAKEAAPSE